MTILQTIHLSYQYGKGTPFEKTALNHINMTVESGDFIGIIGHTGSGKSTLVQHFNGLMRPTEGKILLEGKNIWEDKEARLQSRYTVGVVFQYPEYQLFEDTVGKDIGFGPKNMGLSEDEISCRVKESLRLVDLPEEYANKNPFDLSGGQKRRVALAGILAMRPNILVLDEPTSGLDPQGRKQIMSQIVHYKKTFHATVILISHNMEEIARYTNKTMILDHGSCCFYGPTSEAFRHIGQLNQAGLKLPIAAQVLNALKEKGYPVQSDRFTPEEAAEEIERLYHAIKEDM